MPRRELVVVTDQVPRSGYPAEVVGVAVTTVDWNDIRRLKTIKDNLPSRGHDQCRLVAIDRSSHFAAVQAYGLGATDLLKRPFDIHELSVVLHRHFGQGAVRGS